MSRFLGNFQRLFLEGQFVFADIFIGIVLGLGAVLLLSLVFRSLRRSKLALLFGAGLGSLVVLMIAG